MNIYIIFMQISQNIIRKKCQVIYKNEIDLFIKKDKRIIIEDNKFE